MIRESSPNQSECGDAKKLFVSGVYENLMPMYAAILSAYRADKEIAFMTNSCGGEGYTNL